VLDEDCGLEDVKGTGMARIIDDFAAAFRRAGRLFRVLDKRSGARFAHGSINQALHDTINN